MKTAPWKTKPCICVLWHRPKPEYSELHHVYPVKNQLEDRGKVVDKELEPLCPTSHRSCHLFIDAVLDGTKLPRVNKHVKMVALDGVYRILKGRGEKDGWTNETIAAFIAQRVGR